LVSHCRHADIFPRCRIRRCLYRVPQGSPGRSGPPLSSWQRVTSNGAAESRGLVPPGSLRTTAATEARRRDAGSPGHGAGESRRRGRHHRGGSGVGGCTRLPKHWVGQGCGPWRPPSQRAQLPASGQVELPGITGDAVNDALADLHRCSQHQHYALAGHGFRLGDSWLAPT
jgi:hypothetical protein